MVSKKEWKVFHLPSRDVEKLICRKWKKNQTVSEFRSATTCRWNIRIHLVFQNCLKCGEELQKFLAGVEGIMNSTKIVSIECHYFYPHLSCVSLFIYSHHAINGWPILTFRERTSKPSSQDVSVTPVWAHFPKDNAQLCSTILTALSWGWN